MVSSEEAHALSPCSGLCLEVPQSLLWSPEGLFQRWMDRECGQESQCPGGIKGRWLINQSTDGFGTSLLPMAWTQYKRHHEVALQSRGGLGRGSSRWESSECQGDREMEGEKTEDGG